MTNVNGNQPNNDHYLEKIQTQSLEAIAPKDLASSSNGQGKPITSIVPKSDFDQPLALSQSPKWIPTILWTLVGSVTVAVIWASVAKIGEAIPAQGKLEPQGIVKEVRIPANGVLTKVWVEDGQKVEKDQLLLEIDATVAQSQLESLQKLHKNLQQENQFYREVLNGKVAEIDGAKASVVPTEFFALARNREALITEMQLYRMQINGGGADLTGDQQDRLMASKAELGSRSQAAEASIAQSLEQLNQTRINRSSKERALDIEKDILKRIKSLCKEGAVSELQCLKQQQLVQTNESEIRQLAQEEMRIQAAIAEGQARLSNTFDITRKEFTNQIADNTKRIAEIDSQFTKALVENTKKLTEVESQIKQAEVLLKNQKLLAPASGTVFELKAGPGYVANPNAGEVVLKIVPDDLLVAKVFISNRDIGFVQTGMSVDVRIDSFPFTEFSDINGELIWIGSDALPPDQTNPNYRFPAKVKLARQSLNGKDGIKLNLKSGMSLTANINTKRDRTVMSLFTDSFVKSTNSLKELH